MAKKIKKKRRAKFTPIIVESPYSNKKRWSVYNYEDSVINLNKLLRELDNEINEKLKETSKAFMNSVREDSIKAIKDNILNKDYSDPKTLFKKIDKVLKKVYRRKAIQLSINDAYEQLNRGEELALQANAMNMAKTWVTQFDGKVREWHARVHNQTRLKTKLFTVVYPGGTDMLKGPKIPPISPANFINCRCFMEFRVKKR